jgi:hypothetical protein
MLWSRYKIKHKIIFGISIFLIACNATGTAVSTAPTSTLTEKQLVLAGVGAYFGAGFYSNQAACIQAVDSGTTKQCAFPAGIELITKSEWKQLFSDTTFYLVDIGSWRSAENLFPHQTQDGGLSRYIVAWQGGQAYPIEKFDRLLEINRITITDTNRELIAKSFALMSIPNYLGGEVRFLEWQPVGPGTYRHNYSHSLKAWTEVWGCEIWWWFVFTGQKLSIVSRGGGSSCHISEYGDYIEDRRYFQAGDEAVLLGIPPSFEDYFFNR